MAPTAGPDAARSQPPGRADHPKPDRKGRRLPALPALVSLRLTGLSNVPNMIGTSARRAAPLVPGLARSIVPNEKKCVAGQRPLMCALYRSGDCGSNS
jgi:hypothetical protein